MNGKHNESIKYAKLIKIPFFEPIYQNKSSKVEPGFDELWELMLLISVEPEAILRCFGRSVTPSKLLQEVGP